MTGSFNCGKYPYMYSLFRFDLCYLLTYPSPNQQQSMCCSVTLISRRITGSPGSHLYPRASFLIIVPPLQHPSNKEDNNDHCVVQFFIQRSCTFWLHHVTLPLLDLSLSYYFLFRVKAAGLSSVQSVDTFIPSIRP